MFPNKKLSSFEEEENSYSDRPWWKLIRKLDKKHLENLRINFGSNHLTKEDFTTQIKLLFDENYSNEAVLLFNEACTVDKKTIDWTTFLDFLVESFQQLEKIQIKLKITKVIEVPHVKKETIAKIVQIETEKYFCFAIIAKHGQVGIYDGNLNFLTTYHLIFTREDINRKEHERRRRNRWITDSIFCPDIKMLIITNTARSILIYDASGLKHVPLFIILSTPNIVQAFAYKPIKLKSCTLFMGDSEGCLSSFNFKQANTGLLRKKFNDKINLFYWNELKRERSYVSYRNYSKLHENEISRLVYCQDNEALISSSQDSTQSIVKRNVNKTYIFKIPRGVNCFCLSRLLKLLITGSQDGKLRLWNPIITSKPIGILQHESSIVDVIIFEKQNKFLSCSFDAVVIQYLYSVSERIFQNIKLWEIKEQKCLQSITINFPSFSIFGKTIEWGSQSIYAGAKRQMNCGSKWERSPLLISCCNHIALIECKFEKSFEVDVLPPPPLQNSVLVPTEWNTVINASKEADNLIKYEVDKEVISKRLEDLKFILDRNLFDKDYLHSDINHKIAKLEKTKIKIKVHVERGAPYSALDLHEINEIQLKDVLPVPNKLKNIKALSTKVKALLNDASKKDLIFSEGSSSKSSRSSIVEFEY